MTKPCSHCGEVIPGMSELDHAGTSGDGYLCSKPDPKGLLPEYAETPASHARSALTILGALRYALEKDSPNPQHVAVCLEGIENRLWSIERHGATREAGLNVALPDAIREGL